MASLRSARPRERGYSMRFPRHASRLALSAGLTTASLVGGYQFPTVRSHDIGPPGDDAIVDRFHDRQRAGGRFFRWSSGDSGVVLEGVEWNRDQELTLRIASGPRPQAAGPAEVVVSVNGRAVGRVTATLEPAGHSVPVPRAALSPWGDAAVTLAVATFPLRGRDVGVAVEGVALRPAHGFSAGLALPPLGTLAQWTVSGWIFLAFVLRTPLAASLRRRSATWAAGALALSAAAAVAREAVSAFAWEGIVALGLCYALACEVPRWRAASRRGERVALGFLHTLGIDDHRCRRWIEGAAITVLAVHFLCVVVVPLRWWGPKDLSIYHHVGVVWREGGDYYDVDAMRERFGQGASARTVFAFTSPPSSVVFYVPLSFLSLERATVLWRVLNIGSLVTAGGLLWSAVRLSVATPPSLFWFALALSASEPARITLRLGQVGLLVLGLLALGFWGVAARRSSATALGLVLASALKVIPGLVFLHTLYRRDWRTLTAAAALGCALLGGLLWTEGVSPWRTWLRRVLPAISAPVAYAGNQSVVGFAQRASGQAPLEPPRFNYTFEPTDEQKGRGAVLVGYAVAGLALALSLWRLGAAPGADLLSRLLEFATMIPLFLLLSPLVWEFYLAWLLVPILTVAAWLGSRPLPAVEQIGLVAFLALAWALMQYDTTETYTRPGWPVPLMSLGLYANVIILGCCLRLLGRRDAQGAQPPAETAAA